MIRRAADAVLGASELLRLAALSGFRFQGPYWRWRLHTAFGLNAPPRGELIASALAYGRWARRMRTGR